jgi:hypothetical protein
MRIGTAALIVCAATAASANTGHHDVGGGGGGTAECIRWEPIPVDMAGADMTVVDMAGADMAGADMAGLDGGVARGDMAIGVRCAERASLFNCAYAPGGAASDRGNGVAVALLFAVVVFDVVRARRRRRSG